MKNYLLTAGLILSLSACASIENSEHVPVSLSFSDGSSGTCTITNKRMTAEVNIPSTATVRRSDDDLQLDCITESGQRVTASAPSSIGEKFYWGVALLDFGLIDSITDKHREYPENFVIIVPEQ